MPVDVAKSRSERKKKDISDEERQRVEDMDIDLSRRNEKAIFLLDDERQNLDEYIESIHYSPHYSDDQFQYRHVQIPKGMLKAIPSLYHDPSKGTLKLLWEDEWRNMGITQSLGWEHYEVHEPEPHILLFKRWIPK